MQLAKTQKKIEEYIRNQLKEDHAAVQSSIDFDGDPFEGQPVMNTVVGPFRGHFRGSWYQRAKMPENEKPPDFPVDNYCFRFLARGDGWAKFVGPKFRPIITAILK